MGAIIRKICLVLLLLWLWCKCVSVCQAERAMCRQRRIEWVKCPWLIERLIEWVKRCCVLKRSISSNKEVRDVFHLFNKLWSCRVIIFFWHIHFLFTFTYDGLDGVHCTFFLCILFRRNALARLCEIESLKPKRQRQRYLCMYVCNVYAMYVICMLCM